MPIAARIARRTAGALLALSAVAASGTAFGADAIPADEFAPAPVVEPARSVLLGAGVGFAPSYEGSDEYRVFGFPILSFDTGVPGPRRFEFRGLDDIRLHVLRYGGFSAGPIAGYRFGRDEDDADILDGIGDIDGGVVGGTFVAYDVLVSPSVSLGVDLGVSSQFSGEPFDEDVPGNDTDDDYGFEVDFGASANLALTPRARLALRAGAVYASDDYMDVHFGINAAQAAASTEGLDAFDADEGIKNVYLNANLAFDVTDRVELRAGLGYSRLVGDAADSPVSVEDDQFSGSLGAGYRFRF